MSLSLLTLPVLRSLIRGLPISYLPPAHLSIIGAPSPILPLSVGISASSPSTFPLSILFPHQTLSMDNPAGENSNPTSTALALRPHRSAGATGSGGGGREDCWSEGATAVLIEAWGERHLRCNRGNLRQNDWREVADAVNGREYGSKPPKSDIQCKNRIDTLKKKYKIEKAKTGPSRWRFYNRIDYLIGPGGSSSAKKFGAVSPESSGGAFLAKTHPTRFIANPNTSTNPNSNPKSSGLWSRGSSSMYNSAESSDESERPLRSAREFNNGGSDTAGCDLAAGRGQRGRKHGRLEEEGYVVVPPQPDDEDDEETAAFRELAKAIVKFGEIYERVESSKQKQMMDLEKQRMKFTKEIEFQRMNMIMDAQLQIEKLKRAKNASTTAGKKL